MKSILQEASTVAKAVEKAWIKAGRPLDFSVKIFNVERKGFLGFARRPAVVSLSFESVRQLEQPQRTERPYREKRAERPRYRPQGGAQEREFDQNRERNTKSRGYEEDFNSWTRDSIKDINIWIKELVDVMGIKINFTVAVSHQLLKISFDKPVVPEASDERLLFSSYAYVLMQFLKRKHKKKFRDCRIAITSNRQ